MSKNLTFMARIRCPAASGTALKVDFVIKSDVVHNCCFNSFF
jgi:hypothetical protein